MVDPEMRQAAADWGWARQSGDLKVGGCLTFARGVSAVRVIEAFGMNPDRAEVLSEAAALARFPAGSPPWIRVGTVGGWAFAIETLSLVSTLEDIAMGLSVGTESVVVDWTAKPTRSVRYFADGVLMTLFDDAPSYRTGRAPDRFLAEMRQIGMKTDPADPQPEPPQTREAYLEWRRQRIAEMRLNYRDPVIMMLGMLTLALDIRLPEEVARGPLLTASRVGVTELSGVAGWLFGDSI